MASFLLAWNPKRWHWENLAGFTDAFKRGEVSNDRWSCGRNKHIATGDHALSPSTHMSAIQMHAARALLITVLVALFVASTSPKNIPSSCRIISTPMIIPTHCIGVNGRRGFRGSGSVVGGEYGFIRGIVPSLASDLNRRLTAVWKCSLTSTESGSSFWPPAQRSSVSTNTKSPADHCRAQFVSAS